MPSGPLSAHHAGKPKQGKPKPAKKPKPYKGKKK